MLCDFAQRIDGFEFAFVPVTLLIHRTCLAHRVRKSPCRRRRIVAVLARQQTTRERVVRNHREIFFVCKRQQFTFDLPEQQVVARLKRHEARDAQHVGAPQCPREPVREKKFDTPT